MKAEKTIVKQARELLSKGNLPAAVGVTTVLSIAVLTCIYISSLLVDTLNLALGYVGITVLGDFPLLYAAVYVLFMILALIFTLPLFLGSTRFYYNMAKNEDCRFSDLFHYVQKGKYFRTIGKMLRIITGHFWQAIISFLPGVLIFLTAAAAAGSKEILDFYNVLWYFVSYAMIIAGFILFSFLTAGRSLAIYILTEREDLCAKTALLASEQAMHGYEKSAYRIMFLSLPFLVLCLAVIPLLFVIPYIMTSYAVSAKWIIMLQNKQNEG